MNSKKLKGLDKAIYEDINIKKVCHSTPRMPRNKNWLGGTNSGRDDPERTVILRDTDRPLELSDINKIIEESYQAKGYPKVYSNNGLLEQLHVDIYPIKVDSAGKRSRATFKGIDWDILIEEISSIRYIVEAANAGGEKRRTQYDREHSKNKAYKHVPTQSWKGGSQNESISGKLLCILKDV